MKLNRGLLFAMPVIAGLLMIYSCATPGIMDLDNTQISQKVCSDYEPPSSAPADCVTSQEAIQGDDPSITHPVLFGLSIAIALIWISLLIGDARARRESDVQVRTATGMGGGRDVRRPAEPR